jgi:hypothetical protein
VEAKESPVPAKPLLLVDIDGVLSLFGFPPHAPPEGSMHFIDGIPHFLSPTAARRLLALVSLFELVWCSDWEERADGRRQRERYPSAGSSASTGSSGTSSSASSSTKPGSESPAPIFSNEARSASNSCP